MDLEEYRNSERERARVASLMELLPADLNSALDVGARDGFISRLLADRFASVTALDLEQPSIEHEKVICVKGDITGLSFPDGKFDLVFCAEVLEHIPQHLLAKACDELVRVSNRYLVIGVPFKQDIRVGRTTCAACGKENPPWGHVNSFDEKRLQSLFKTCSFVKTSYIGSTNSQTNWCSTLLMDLSGNPYGTYDQDEPCVHCGGHLGAPQELDVIKKVFSKLAIKLQQVTQSFVKPHANWIHILFEKQ
jgi:Methyltransferase domain